MRLPIALNPCSHLVYIYIFGLFPILIGALWYLVGAKMYLFPQRGMRSVCSCAYLPCKFLLECSVCCLFLIVIFLLLIWESVLYVLEIRCVMHTFSPSLSFHFIN